MASLPSQVGARKIVPGKKNRHKGCAVTVERAAKRCEEPLVAMLTKLIVGALSAALFASAAMADFYIVQEKSTKKCKVVYTRPTDKAWIQVGPVAFKTREDAEKQVPVVCKEKMEKH